MPLATRVIPSILCRRRQQVKGKCFQSWRSVGLAAQAVRVHQQRGVDEVCLLDVGATPEGRGPDLGLVEELAEVMFAPLAVGGGIKHINDVRALFRAGADKVVIGTAGIKLIAEVAGVVGRQAVVAALDVKREGGEWVPHIECGKRSLHGNATLYAQMLERAGAGEILLTSIDREGTMEGYDLDLIRKVAKAVDIPVIAHGGCRDYADMADAIHAGASAVAAGALFQFTDSTPREAARALADYGIEVRL
jgi:cyclase